MLLVGFTFAFALLALTENVFSRDMIPPNMRTHVINARGKEYVGLPPVDESMSVNEAAEALCSGIKHPKFMQSCILQIMTDTEGDFECCTSTPSDAESCIDGVGRLALFDSKCDPRIRKPDGRNPTIASWLAIGASMPGK